MADKVRAVKERVHHAAAGIELPDLREALRGLRSTLRREGRHALRCQRKADRGLPRARHAGGEEVARSLGGQHIAFPGLFKNLVVHDRRAVAGAHQNGLIFCHHWRKCPGDLLIAVGDRAAYDELRAPDRLLNVGSDERRAPLADLRALRTQYSGFLRSFYYRLIQTVGQINLMSFGREDRTQRDTGAACADHSDFFHYTKSFLWIQGSIHIGCGPSACAHYPKIKLKMLSTRTPDRKISSVPKPANLTLSFMSGIISCEW